MKCLQPRFCTGQRHELCTDNGVDVRGTVKGHRHGREALRGMLPYNMESRSPVFLFRVLPSDSIRRRGTAGEA